MFLFSWVILNYCILPGSIHWFWQPSEQHLELPEQSESESQELTSESDSGSGSGHGSPSSRVAAGHTPGLETENGNIY